MRLLLALILICAPGAANAVDFGLNLSAPNGYMSPYHREMIPQGYFHEKHWRSVITVRSVSNNVVVADFWETTWNNGNIGWPLELWTDGRWENPLTGETGTIMQFSHSGERPTFRLDKIVKVRPGDPLFIYQDIPARTTWSAPNNYTPVIREYYNGYQKQTNSAAPQAIDWRGEYVLDADVSGGSVRLVAPGIDKTWTGAIRETFNVTVNPGGMPSVDLYIVQGGPVTINRLSLKRAGIGGVTAQAFEALSSLKPKVLRYWQTQHGQSLQGMVEGHFHGYSIKDARPNRWELPLPDFLALCEALQARPWVVCPTVITDAEIVELASMLPQESYLEFGNETWGSNNPHSDPFAGASLGGAYPYVAQKKLMLIEHLPVTTIIGGQIGVNPETRLNWTRMMKSVASSADRVALGAYYNSLDMLPRTWDDLGEVPLYYEIQSHQHVRPHALNATMIGAVVGIYHLLDAPDDLCVFTAFQYETAKDVFLWGIFENTADYKPRPLAVAWQGLVEFDPVTRTDNLTWTDGETTLYLAGAEGRMIPESYGKMLVSPDPTVPNELVAWADWTGTQMPPWSIFLGSDHVVAPTEMNISVPPNINRIVLQIEK